VGTKFYNAVRTGPARSAQPMQGSAEASRDPGGHEIVASASAITLDQHLSGQNNESKGSCALFPVSYY
jgi:hypothetical protein